MLNKFSAVLLVIAVFLSLLHINTPFLGVHQIRQSDTLMAGLLYFQEDAPFLEPRVGFRGSLEKGIAIGEFPIYSFLLGQMAKVIGWHEATAKILVYLFLLFGAWFWACFFYQDRRQIFIYLFFCFAIPITFAFILIPIPDAMAVLLTGAGAYLHRRQSRPSSNLFCSNLQAAIGSILFAIGIIVRPYYIFLGPLMFLNGRRYWSIWTGFLSILLYFWWYKMVAPSSEISSYYEIKLHPLSETLAEFPKAISEGLWLLFRDHLSIFGIYFFYVGAKADTRTFFVWLGSFVCIFILRGTHPCNHQYYLFGTTLMAVYLISFGYSKITSTELKSWLILGMIINLIATDQHLWHDSQWDYNHIREVVAERTKVTDRICTEGFPMATGLYLARRTGWTTVHNGDCANEKDSKLTIRSDDYLVKH